MDDERTENFHILKRAVKSNSKRADRAGAALDEFLLLRNKQLHLDLSTRDFAAL